jgi:hypothetical protein
MFLFRGVAIEFDYKLTFKPFHISFAHLHEVAAHYIEIQMTPYLKLIVIISTNVDTFPYFFNFDFFLIRRRWG